MLNNLGIVTNILQYTQTDRRLVICVDNKQDAIIFLRTCNSVGAWCHTLLRLAGAGFL